MRVGRRDNRTREWLRDPTAPRTCVGLYLAAAERAAAELREERRDAARFAQRHFRAVET